MHFETLEKTYKELGNDDNLSKTEKQEFFKAILQLDDWLVQVKKQKLDQINPLEFAESKKITWEFATKLFKILANKAFFSTFFVYHSPSTDKVLTTSFSRDEIVKRKTIFDSGSNKEITINPDLIETSFMLAEIPYGKHVRKKFKIGDIVSNPWVPHNRKYENGQIASKYFIYLGVNGQYIKAINLYGKLEFNPKARYKNDLFYPKKREYKVVGHSKGFEIMKKELEHEWEIDR